MIRSCFSGFRLFHLLSSILATVLCPFVAYCQPAPALQSPPHQIISPAATGQEQFIPYWTTETGWHSELQLRNNLAQRDLTITPALRLADGTEVELPAATVKPQEVRIVDLEQAVIGSKPQFIGTFGSVVLRYNSPDAGNLFAMAMIHNIGHSIAFHIDATTEIKEPQARGREGIWWLPNDTANDYLLLTNQGSTELPVDLSLYDSIGRETKQRIVLPPRAMNRLSIRELTAANKLPGSFGGIKIFAPAHGGSLGSLQVVFDEKASFSALLKMFDRDPSATLQQRDYAKTNVWTLRAPMLALSQPDPELAFPEATVLQPQIFVRNTLPKPVNVNLRFNWRNAAASGKAPGPSFRLRPFETRRVDVATLQSKNALPKDANWASVILTTDGLPDEVVAAATSYDATLRYGAQTPFSDQLAFQWEGSLWEYDAQHNSLVTAGNGGTKPLQARFTIYYNRGTQKYQLEQSLQPDEQMWIDVGKLIREKVPDKNANILPADLSSGSYELRDLTNKGIGTLFEGKVVYDKTYGHVTYGCAACCGYVTVSPWYNPLAIPLGFTAPNGVNAYNTCDSNTEDVSDAFYGNWTTANHSFATVAYDGTFTGVAVGLTTSTTTGNLQSAHHPLCPVVNYRCSGNDDVTQLSCPPSVTRGSNVTCSVSNPPSGASYSKWIFTDSNNNTVTSNSTSISWSGLIVTSGTVSVTVTAGSGGTSLSATISVTNRTGLPWTFTPASATAVSNGFLCQGTNITLLIPSPPSAAFTDNGTATGALGAFCDNPGTSYISTTITDQGPNNGYQYVSSVTQGSGSQPWAYDYAISPDLQNASSTFSLYQCGNYNSQTKPNGFISQPNLLTNAVRHESGSAASHYAQYVAALNATASNPGMVAEQQVGAPGLTSPQFQTNVNNALVSAATNLNSATKSPEPADCDHTAAGAFQGYTNFAPYTACN